MVCDAAVGAFFDGLDAEALKAELPPLRLFWRARVLADGDQVKALVEAHPEPVERGAE